MGLDIPSDLQDGAGPMSSAALMSMLNDGSFDMNALFQTENLGYSPQQAASPTSATGFNGPFAASNGNGMLNMVASP